MLGSQFQFINEWDGQIWQHPNEMVGKIRLRFFPSFDWKARQICLGTSGVSGTFFCDMCLLPKSTLRPKTPHALLLKEKPDAFPPSCVSPLVNVQDILGVSCDTALFEDYNFVLNCPTRTVTQMQQDAQNFFEQGKGNIKVQKDYHNQVHQPLLCLPPTQYVPLPLHCSLGFGLFLLNFCIELCRAVDEKDQNSTQTLSHRADFPSYAALPQPWVGIVDDIYHCEDTSTLDALEFLQELFVQAIDTCHVEIGNFMKTLLLQSRHHQRSLLQSRHHQRSLPSATRKQS